MFSLSALESVEVKNVLFLKLYKMYNSRLFNALCAFGLWDHVEGFEIATQDNAILDLDGQGFYFRFDDNKMLVAAEQYGSLIMKEFNA